MSPGDALPTSVWSSAHITSWLADHAGQRPLNGGRRVGGHRRGVLDLAGGKDGDDRLATGGLHASAQPLDGFRDERIRIRRAAASRESSEEECLVAPFPVHFRRGGRWPA